MLLGRIDLHLEARKIATTTKKSFFNYVSKLLAATLDNLYRVTVWILQFYLLISLIKETMLHNFVRNEAFKLDGTHPSLLS